MSSPFQHSYDAIIFDLGGVILPLDPGASIAAFTKLLGLNASDLYTQTRQVDLFDRFERGEVNGVHFRQELVSLGRAKAPSETALDSAWNAMLGSIPAQNLDLLFQLKQRKRTFVLSNTNEIHVARFLADYERDHGSARTAFSDHFEAVHFSHDLGMRKPEERIFVEVLGRHGLVPERTLFIDDNPENVAAAARVGILARHHTTNSPLAEAFANERV